MAFKQDKQKQALDPDAFSLPETVLDGVRYARLQDSGQLWRLGSLSPHWREELPVLGKNPGQELLRNLAEKNIFLSSGDRPRLAVMCCGLGSAWPGMGRELYDNFPAARAAMDSLAAYADWDLLSIMDESDPELLNHSRMQIPYLFMLEYAQWSQLLSLGLKPDLICGHSLGELVALCLSGVYDPDAAWHLFEIRSAHMTRLEENSANESGMLGISADYGTVRQALEEYPDLRISNCNTARQYILGGPRSQLLELRKNLRRKRIPAFMLGVNLAFHNPSMRVLRDLSLRRLNGLEMRPPQIPILSCITAAPYPHEQMEICRHIADLDENTVDWPKSVSAIRKEYKIQHFLELGPQETLCGLVSEIYPQAHCLPASRKGHESLAMRQLCARLYSMGLLRDKNISSRPSQKSSALPFMPKDTAKEDAPPEIKERSPAWQTVMELLAEESGHAVQDLRPELDLRYDLALRSSRFPYLVQEAERRLNRQIALENLLQISTVGELANFLTGEDSDSGEAKSASGILAVDRPSRFILPPLAAYKLAPAAKNGLEAWRPNPDAAGLFFQPSGCVALCVMDDEALPQIWSGMAPFALKLLVPSFLMSKCAPLARGGSTLLSLDIAAETDADGLLKAMTDADKQYGPLKGILYIPPPLTEFAISRLPDPILEFLSILPKIMARCSNAWLCCLERQSIAPRPEMTLETGLAQAREFFKRLNSLFPRPDFPLHMIFWQDLRALPKLQNPNEPGDMLSRELLYAAPRELVWLDAGLDPTWGQSPVYCPASSCMDVIQTERTPSAEARPAAFRGECQFSTFARPELASHGALPIPAAMSPGKSAAPWLPLGYILKSLLAASRLACPWLIPFEMSDVLIDSFPLLPYGLVRECRVQAQGRQWLPREKRLARLCHASMSVQELSPNGRRRQDWTPVCEALCILGNANREMAAYHKTPLPDIAYSPVSEALLRKYYAYLRFGDEWTFLRSFAVQKNLSANESAYCFQAEIAEMPEYIAESAKWDYDAFAFLMEAVCQALSLSLLLQGHDAASLEDIPVQTEKWSCRRIGFLRFVDSLEQYREGLQLTFNRSWKDKLYTRFDGRIDTLSGKTILSFLHFEFKHLG